MGSLGTFLTDWILRRAEKVATSDGVEEVKIVGVHLGAVYPVDRSELVRQLEVAARGRLRGARFEVHADPCLGAEDVRVVTVSGAYAAHGVQGAVLAAGS